MKKHLTYPAPRYHLRFQIAPGNDIAAQAKDLVAFCQKHGVEEVLLFFAAEDWNNGLLSADAFMLGLIVEAIANKNMQLKTPSTTPFINDTEPFDSMCLMAFNWSSIPDGDYGFEPRHAGKSNIVWADGHVDSMTSLELLGLEASVRNASTNPGYWHGFSLCNGSMK